MTGRYFAEGSVLRGDRRAMADSYSVEVLLDSDDTHEQLAKAIAEAEASCFTIAALRNPTPVDLTTTVNGRPFVA